MRQAIDEQRGISEGTTPDFLAGGGEMGAMLRAFDWSCSSLGPAAQWPHPLKLAVSIALNSRFPIVLWWGAELAMLYNNAYRPILGANKHPGGLGRPAVESWAEIWDIIGPPLRGVMERGEASWAEDQLLPMDRFGYLEEAYFTYSYSPIKHVDGRIGGVFTAVSETTERVLGERRLRALRELAEQGAETSGVAGACEAFARVLGSGKPDVPFALLYLLDDDGQTARLCATAGIGDDDPRIPATIARDANDDPWAVAAALGRAAPVLIAHADARFGVLPGGAWPEPTTQAIALPIARAGHDAGMAGVMVVGINPRRALDNSYRDFLHLAAGHLATVIANARAYEEERRRAEALAEIDRAKTAFFSNVSHEFRTPLTLLLGPLEEAMAAGALPPAQGECLAVAHRHGLRLLKLVNALLDFSRIEAGRAQGRFAPVDLAALTAELASMFRSATERAGLRLNIVAPTLPEPVHVDRDMWETVVLNLLSNAFKFTFEGGIDISVRTSADSRGAEVEVRDSGTGIPAEELPRLFERFHRIEGAQGRSYEGSGIGLALVQELVRMHGGTIRVESSPGAGSRFIVALPFGTAHLPPERVMAAPAAESAAGLRARAMVEEALRWLSDDVEPLPDAAGEPPIAEPSQAGSLGGRVLLADDNADMRDYVRRLLSAQGFSVAVAANGAAALAAAQADPPDLVLTDVMMPGLDGFGLLRALRADPGLASIPVVLLSARAGEEQRVEGLRAGADDYLIKPFSARELLARVGANLSLARLRRDATEALRSRTAELETVLQAVPAAVWFTHDTNAATVHGNRQAAALLGLPEETNHSASGPDARHLGFRNLHDGVAVAAEQLPMQRAARGEDVPDGLMELRFEDGRALSLFMRSRTLRDGQGRPRGAVTAAIDVTERERAAAALRQSEDALRRLAELLEARVAERTDDLAASNRRLVAEIEERERVQATLHQMQRLEAVGQLTSGVAHDFNNLLTVVLGNIEVLEREADERAARPLAMMRVAAERGANLTAQLLAFSRRQLLKPKPVDLNAVVAGMAELMRSTLGGTVELQTVLAPGLWPALVDPTQLELVVLNLAINARDAMLTGGSLTVATANVPAAASGVGGEPKEMVMVAVSDTGTGMSEVVRARAFEPFFTTKPPGRGSGLGLAQVWGFAHQSGGDVAIASREGEGTTVRVFLPRATAGVAVAAAGRGAAAGQAGTRPYLAGRR